MQQWFMPALSQLMELAVFFAAAAALVVGAVAVR